MRAGLRGLVTSLLIGAVALHGTPAVAAEVAPADAVSLIVGLRSGAAAAAPVDRLDARTDVDVVDSQPITGAVTVDVPAGDVTEAADALRGDPAVAYVEVDHVAHTSAVPNDPSYRGQWGLVRSRLGPAWTAGYGSADVTIAVVDTGVKAVADLAGRLLPGYDFANDDADATDDAGHGTMTAGVLGAAGDNGIGAAGLCWSCRILPVKVLGADGRGSYSDIAEGIRYAADRGADIVNLSLGGADDSQLLRDAVNYAVAKGALVVAAAGNDGHATKHYPAAFPAVLAVAGSTVNDARYPWSNHGAGWVDIAAPGCNLAQSTAGVVGDFCGTSSAAPFVSGVAALLASVTPAPTAGQIRTALMSSARKVSGTWIPASSGRVDAAGAVLALPFRLTGVGPGSYLGDSLTLQPRVAAGSGITRVTAVLNGVTVATATAAPWTLVVRTAGLADGAAATLTVTATGSSPARTQSGYATPVQAATVSLPVTVDRTPPATSFRFPATSALVRGTATVGVNAWDAVGISRVQLLVGGKVVGTDSAAPFALLWNSAGHNGAVALTLRTYDRAGNAATATRTVAADNWGPAVQVTAPPSGTRGIRGTARVGIRASDLHGISRVQVLVNGALVNGYAAAAHTFAVDTSRYGARMTVQVRAYDRVGNVRYAPARTWYR
jgi:thermitase